MIKRRPNTSVVRMTKRRFDKILKKTEQETIKKIFAELDLCLMNAIDFTDVCEAILELEEKYGVDE